MKTSVHHKILLVTLLAAVFFVVVLGLFLQSQLSGSISLDWLFATENEKTLRLAAAISIAIIAVSGLLISRTITTSLERLQNTHKNLMLGSTQNHSNHLWMNFHISELQYALKKIRAEIELFTSNNDRQVFDANKKLVDSMHREILQMERSITELRHSMRTDQPSASHERTHIDMSEFISESLHNFYENFNARGVRVSVQRCSTSIVLADTKQLKKLLNILLASALDSAAPQTEVTINCYRTAVSISVHLHHMHYRCDADALALCTSIIEQHNGAMSALPSEKGGTEIIFMLPLVKQT